MTSATAVTASATVAELLGKDGITREGLAAHLDALDQAARIAECRALSGAQQKRLWVLAVGAPAFGLDDLVPPATGDKTIIFAGKNSLPVFSAFEKRFRRFEGQVVGYNHQSTSWATGPGYFTVVPGDGAHAGELLFDYTRVPGRTPDGWPRAKPNTGGMSRLVYGNLHDYLRRVSQDVIIGSALRAGKDLDSYFVLARAATI